MVLFWLIGATGRARQELQHRPDARRKGASAHDAALRRADGAALARCGGRVQVKDMKLAMRAGKGRHYRVADIHGAATSWRRRWPAGFSRGQVAVGVSEDIRGRAEQAFDRALAEMPPRGGLSRGSWWRR